MKKQYTQAPAFRLIKCPVLNILAESNKGDTFIGVGDDWSLGE